MTFVPDKENGADEVPYLDDARSSEGWQGHTTKESFAKLKAQICSEIALLGGIVTRFIKGTYQINSKNRPGIQLIYEVTRSDGFIFNGKIDIAGLPWRAPYGGKKYHGGYAKVEESKRDLSLRMALYNVREALRAMRILQVLSPSYSPLIPWMLVNGDKTISETWLLSDIKRLPEPDISEGNFHVVDEGEK